MVVTLSSVSCLLLFVPPLPNRPAEPVALTWLFNFVAAVPRCRISSTSGGVHVPSSYHYRHRAVDVVGPPASLLELIGRAVRRHAEFREAFYDPYGKYVKDGKIRLGEVGGHEDHVHLAR